MGDKMKMQEALAQYESDVEKFYRLRRNLQLGLNTERPGYYTYPPLTTLEDGPPQKPNPVWIVKPKDFTGKEQVAYYGSRVKVGDQFFYTGSGKAISGRNALRHGRINWPETEKLLKEWNEVSKKINEDYNNALAIIDQKWSKWAWDQGDESRVYIFENNEIYAITTYPGVAGFVVSNALKKEHLHRARPELFKTVSDLLKTYPNFKSYCQELE